MKKNVSRAIFFFCYLGKYAFGIQTAEIISIILLRNSPFELVNPNLVNKMRLVGLTQANKLKRIPATKSCVIVERFMLCFNR